MVIYMKESGIIAIRVGRAKWYMKMRMYTQENGGETTIKPVISPNQTVKLYNGLTVKNNKNERFVLIITI